MTEVAVKFPRGLHGRDAELRQLQSALEEPSVRVVLAVGQAGAGKTAILAELLRRSARAGALTGVAQHTADPHGEDLYPFIQAMEQAAITGLDQLYDPDAGQESLGKALGENAAVFAAFGSGLLRSLSRAPLPRTMSSAAAEERIVRACIIVLRWLQGFNQQIILQIDDWGRANERAVRLYHRIITDPRLTQVRLLVSERPDEPSALAADDLCRRTNIAAIGPEAQREIVAEMLAGELVDPAPLLAFLGPASERPFDLVHSVQALASSGGLVRRGGGWVFDPSAQDLTLGSVVPEGAAIRSISRDAAQLALVQTLALFGDGADIGDLLVASGLPGVEANVALSKLGQSGLVRRRDDRLWLSHDRLRSAALDTFDQAARRACAARLAEALRTQGATPGAETRGAIMLWRRLDGGLDQVDSAPWIPLFLLGAAAARQVADREAANAFAEAAMTLSERCDGARHAVLKEGVLAAVDRSDHALAIRRSEQMLRGAANPLEIAEADELRVFANRMSGDLAAAIDAAREGLARAGIHVPLRPTWIDVLRAVVGVVAVSPRWARRQLPYTDEQLALAAPMMRAINGAGSMMAEQNVWLAVVLAVRSVPPSLAAGTAAGAGAYAFLCAMIGQYRRAAQWAEISDLRQSANQPVRAAARQYARSFGHYFVRPHRELTASIDEIEKLAYADGDLAVAAYANHDRLLACLGGETHVSQAIAMAERWQADSARYNDITTNLPNAVLHQAALGLLGGTSTPWRIEGAIVGSAEFNALSATGMTNVRALIAMLEGLLAISYGAYGVGAAIFDRWNGLLRSTPFQSRTQTWNFVTALAFYRTGRRPSRFAVFNLRRLAKLNPTEFAHRVLLLDAEAARLAGRERRAARLYGQAVLAAQNATSLVEAGIVADAASEGAAMLDRPEAERFKAAAIEIWRRIGAEGVLAVRHAQQADARLSSDQLADIEQLRAEVTRLERRQQEREIELRTATEAAVRANRAKSRFLATIGHELRTPLQGLVGLVELSRQTEAELDVAALGSVVGHLKTVVSDLTDLGALEGGVFQLNTAPFDPAELCRGLVVLHEPMLGGPGRTIRLTKPARRVLVLGDEARVRQVLSNLVGNAVKHTRGDIAVELRVRASRQAASVAFDVTDDGPGLDEAAIARLFEPFERGEAAERTEGLGLGLHLARALARRMGGDILVRRTEANGSQFTLELDLPLSRKAKPEPAPPLAVRRVLLAEDSHLNRRVIAALLRAKGCLVEEAADGQAATDLWRTRAFDLVLLDVRMPVLDGLSVARLIRTAQGPGDSQTPIVIATAARTAEIEEAATALGVAAVLQKPLDWNDLVRIFDRSADPPSAAPIQTDRLEELRAALGTDAQDLFADATREVRDAVSRIRAFAAAGDHGAVETEAHRLAGLASTLGLAQLSKTALQLEAEARNGSISRDTVDAVAASAESVDLVSA